MPIFNFCKKCKSSFVLERKLCGKCGEPVPRAGKIYRIIVKANKKTCTKNVPNSLELAKKIEAKIKQELASDTYYDRRKAEHTLNDAANRYFEMVQAKGNKSYKDDKTKYDRYYKESMGKRKIGEIAPAEIEKLILALSKAENKNNRPYAPKTIKNIIDMASTVVNYAIHVGMSDKDNPFKRVKRPKVDNEKTNTLSTDKIYDLLKTLDEFYNPTIANCIKILLYTGIRRGEAYKLKWQNVDLAKRFVTLINPKGGKSETIPLNKNALGVLEEQSKISGSNEYVFTDGEGRSFKYIEYAWQLIKEQAKLPKEFRIHDLRHTFASLLANSGQVDLFTLQNLLTHKSVKMTQRYAHLIDANLHKASAVIDSILSQNK